MTYNLRKTSIDQIATFIDEIGNSIPVYKTDIDKKHEWWNESCTAGPWIENICETSYNMEKIKLFQKIYGVAPQQYIAELRTGFPYDSLEQYEGRIPIELYT